MEGTRQTIELVSQARMVVPEDPAYPASVRELVPGAGPLWIVGRLPERCVTLVGSRRADLGGLRTARALAAELVRAGWTVASGGATGCDAAAHEGALEAGGTTVVVLASGLARPYPREHVGLFERAAAAGAVVTPFAPEVEPLPAHFHRRNRILAALGAATVVVRAGARSGALSTASYARRYGRPVLAVPGSPTCVQAAGSNELLRGGCPVALDARDVLRRLGLPASPPRRSGTGGGTRGDRLLELLAGGEPAGADELAAASGLGAGEVAVRLGLLEATGAVARLTDGRFQASVGRG
ncbi:MAG: DNA-processing protein DprA [Deltaproteobacteria bacterium]|nr:DNA-processing protein DprA [Deltaproteobacteria bacterium]